MPILLLTQHFVDSTKCPKNKRRVDYFDTRLQGLLLKVSTSGRRSYYIRYTDSYSRTKEKKFANANIVPLANARLKAKELLARISLGDDPFCEQSQRKSTPIYRDYIFNHYLLYMKTHKRSWKVDEAQLRLHILPVFGHLYMDEITKQHALDLLQYHRDRNFKPSSTNRMLNVAHRTFSCAIKWEISGVTINPISAINKLKENNLRDRYLTNNELRRLITVLEKSEHPRIKEIIMMLVLTGARRNEVLHAKWSDIDFQKSIWRIEFNKSGITHYVPLSTGAIALLNNINKKTGVDYIFYNPATCKPYSNIFHAWNSVRQSAGIPDIRLHDLRHSYASFLVNQGRSIYEVQKILGHASVKTTQRYAHLSNETLLAATNSVADYVSGVTAFPCLSPSPIRDDTVGSA
ncbi:site-specific integrase [Paenalcaligenes suwonensis]|uniref:site-specific integrase n=1 Tax=Paenalcaligenes suwonensis TaxID=1202713 RepID=UPI00140DB3C1|nr:site-specific integrase [Paenalcaligenes suwonensis]NHC61044.1 tyrosine-type recombinase/integrase [Paenalcaligenes suwonensis]